MALRSLSKTCPQLVNLGDDGRDGDDHDVDEDDHDVEILIADLPATGQPA